MNWGSVPDWVAAIGSTSALLALLWEVRSRRRDDDLRAAEETVADLRRLEAAEGQARRVFLERSEKTLERSAPNNVEVVNDSDDPVTEVVVAVDVLHGAFPPTAISQYVAYLPARTRVRFPLGGLDLRLLLHTLTVAFTDVRGVRWARRGVEPPFRSDQVQPPRDGRLFDLYRRRAASRRREGGDSADAGASDVSP